MRIIKPISFSTDFVPFPLILAGRRPCYPDAMRALLLIVPIAGCATAYVPGEFTPSTFNRRYTYLQLYGEGHQHHRCAA